MVPRSIILAERGAISIWVALASDGDIYAGTGESVLARFGTDSVADFGPALEHRPDAEIVADLESAIPRLLDQGDVELAAALALAISAPVPNEAPEDYRIAEVIIDRWTDDLFDEIERWVGHGFSSTEVEAWTDAGCDLASAIQLRDAGHSPSDAALTNKNISLRTALGMIRLLRDGTPSELREVPALGAIVEAASRENPDPEAFRTIAYVVGTLLEQSGSRNPRILDEDR